MAESPTARRWLQDRVLPFALLFAGLFLWRKAGVPLPVGSLIAVIIALIVATIPRARDRTWRLLGSMRDPSPRNRLGTALLITLGATIYLILTGVFQGRDFVP